jgi:polyphenol oxidase
MIRYKHGMPFLSFSLFEKFGIKAGVSTRRGGVSRGCFQSLNLSFKTGDDAEAVRTNRQRFFSAMGISPLEIVCAVQVHGSHIEKVTQQDKGRGALSRDTSIPDTDGLVTTEKGVPLTLQFADCTPLLLADPVRGVVGLAHGGWRGTAQDIGGKLVWCMVEEYGSRPEHILAGIGPAIGPSSFEVGREVESVFRDLFHKKHIPWDCHLVKPEARGKCFLNLPEINRKLLLKAGVLPHHIENCGIDTVTHTDWFFSYRKSGGKTGRHIAFITQ